MPTLSMENTQMAIYNNPGNIEPNGWAGDTGERYADRFVVFDSPEMGVRAMMRDARKKIKDFDGDVDKIIAKYAPPSENDTEKYSSFIKKFVGKDTVSEDDVDQLVRGIIRFENTPEVADYYDQPDIMLKAKELSKISLPEGYTYEQADRDFGISAAYDNAEVVPVSEEESWLDQFGSSLRNLLK